MEGHVRDEHGDKSYFDDLAEVLNPKHEDEEGRDLKEVQRLCDEWLAEHPDEWVNNAEGLVRQRLGASREVRDQEHHMVVLLTVASLPIPRLLEVCDVSEAR